MDWIDIVCQKSGFTLARLQKCSGTGSSTTIRISGILKLASDRSEFELLQRFEKILGNDYDLIFPRFREVGEIEGQYVMELEYVGDVNLEEVLVGENMYSEIEPVMVVRQVSRYISRFAEVQPEPKVAEDYRRLFLAEIRDGLARNVQTSGLSVEIPPYDRLCEYAVFVPTLCHRDLSVTNVMCETNKNIHLIDPRWVVPGAMCESSVYGSVAIDCASFQVGLERKELERKRMGRPSLCLADLFRIETIAEFLNRGLFNEFMNNLCLAYSYSVYAACRCSYCLAPDRRWLYKLMVEQLKNSLRRII
jgi:hypothetical protein